MGTTLREHNILLITIPGFNPTELENNSVSQNSVLNSHYAMYFFFYFNFHFYELLNKQETVYILQ